MALFQFQSRIVSISHFHAGLLSRFQAGLVTVPIGFCLLLGGCGDGESADRPPTETEAAPETEAEPETPAEPTEAGPIEDGWVEERTSAARERLSQSPAGELLWASIEAHGGLETWLSKGTIEFEFDYAPVGAPARRRHTFQRVDLWSARAHHQEVDHSSVGEPDGLAEFGFDGEVSWMKPDAEAFSPSSRFWSLTPYYFACMPFVLADPGVVLTLEADETLDGQAYRVVKAAFEQGTGDSPDDYYVLYLHASTHRLAALRYVVSFPGMFAPGEHSPEKLMRYTEFVEVDGLAFAGRYDTFGWDAEAGAPTEKVTDVSATRFRLGQTYPLSIFAPPEGAFVEPTP